MKVLLNFVYFYQVYNLKWRFNEEIEDICRMGWLLFLRYDDWDKLHVWSYFSIVAMMILLSCIIVSVSASP